MNLSEFTNSTYPEGKPLNLQFVEIMGCRLCVCGILFEEEADRNQAETKAQQLDKLIIGKKLEKLDGQSVRKNQGEIITTEFIVQKLNELLEIDRDAITKWAWEMFTPANHALVDHPLVDVRKFDEEVVKERLDLEGFFLSPLGVLNFLLRASGSKKVIGAYFDEKGKLVNFIIVDEPNRLIISELK